MREGRYEEGAQGQGFAKKGLAGCGRLLDDAVAGQTSRLHLPLRLRPGGNKRHRSAQNLFSLLSFLSWLRQRCVSCFRPQFNLKFIPLFVPLPPLWVQIITWSDLINNAITLSPTIPLTKPTGWKSMDFPNFNYTSKVSRIYRKLKTIYRLCAVGFRPGATRNAALVPRKTESGTVVSLQVLGAAWS